jgi:ribonuclease HI
VNAYIDMILVHLYKPQANHSRESSSVAKWIPPPEGKVLVNVDAATFTSSKQMGAGIVIRDHMGLCLAACGERSDNVKMPEMAEALAIHRAIVFALEEGFSDIILASDCLSVLQRINSSVIDRSPTGSVVEDIKFYSKSFSSCEFQHVSRVLNVAAH